MFSFCNNQLYVRRFGGKWPYPPNSRSLTLDKMQQFGPATVFPSRLALLTRIFCFPRSPRVSGT